MTKELRCGPCAFVKTR